MIRKIRNCNPRLARVFQKARRKIWRFGLILLIAVSGITGLLALGDGFDAGEKNDQLQPSLMSADATDFLGEGFTDPDKANFGTEATNELVKERGGDFYQEGQGAGIINALTYNVKNYFKYIAGSMATLYIFIAIIQLVVASDDEGIQKGRKNLMLSSVALITVFAIDILVIGFFEGGDLGSPGESLFSAEEIIEGRAETLKEAENYSFVSGIARYFQEDAKYFFDWIKTIGGAAAIIFIFAAGAHMIFAEGTEESIEKEKKYLMHVITAFITLLMLDQFIFGFIYPSDTGDVDGITKPECIAFMNSVSYKSGKVNLSKAPEGCDLSVQDLGEAGTDYILGIVRFFESLLGGIAVFFIVSAGIQIIGSFGDEEHLNKHKKTLFWAFGGLAIVLLSHNLISKFFFPVNPKTGDVSPNIDQGFIDIAGITNFLASFVGIFSVISILAAGIIWVANFGNTEIAEKSKKIILGAIIGVVLSIAAYAIVNTLTSASSAPV